MVSLKSRTLWRLLLSLSLSLFFSATVHASSSERVPAWESINETPLEERQRNKEQMLANPTSPKPTPRLHLDYDSVRREEPDSYLRGMLKEVMLKQRDVLLAVEGSTQGPGRVKVGQSAASPALPDWLRSGDHHTASTLGD